MTQAATYTLEQFYNDLRGVFASVTDPLGRAEGIREHVRRLLQNPEVLEEKLDLPEDGGFGRVDLYVDDEYGHPNPGFLVMCSVQRPGQTNIPHDHGASWVVYGVGRGTIEQRKYRWVYPEDNVFDSSPELQELGRYTQNEGDVAYFLPGEIHTTHNVNDGRSLVLRIEAQDLRGVWRHQYEFGGKDGRAYQSTG